MAEAPAVKKPETLKAPEMQSAVQESLKADLSFIDKAPRNPNLEISKDTALYWYGALPAIGPVPQYSTDKLGNVITTEPTNALAAWTHPEKRPEWYGRCPWFQNITIRGLVFPAFTNYAQRSGFESPSQAIVFNVARAGRTDYFTKTQVDAILFEAAHTMIRPPQNPRAPHTSEIFRLVEVPDAKGGTRWDHPDQDPAHMGPAIHHWDPERDKPVADFVYFIKIQNEFQQQDLLSIMRSPLPSLSGR